MNYRQFPIIDDCSISALGYGCMRFPLVEGTQDIDVEKTRKLLLQAYDAGVNYYDTAWPYHGGKSEEVLGRILEEEGLRDKVYIADKSPIWEIKEEADFDRILDAQLKKLRTDHIDFYLLHALSGESWEKVKKLNGLSFLVRAKKAGKIRHMGFSFHGPLDQFKKIIDEYRGCEFCQIQFNYLDEDGVEQTQNPGKQALEYAAAHEIGCIIMEPLRGGLLANPPKGVADIFAAAERQKPPADWALRFAWERQEVVTVLSGMNGEQQVAENCESAAGSHPNSMPKKQMAVIQQAKDWFKSRIIVPCTRCSYCMPCPQGVEIPRIFAELNGASMTGRFEDGKEKAPSASYQKMIEEGKGADRCVGCGACSAMCPQHIDIPEEIKKAHSRLS